MTSNSTPPLQENNFASYELTRAIRTDRDACYDNLVVYSKRRLELGEQVGFEATVRDKHSPFRWVSVVNWLRSASDDEAAVSLSRYDTTVVEHLPH